MRIMGIRQKCSTTIRYYCNTVISPRATLLIDITGKKDGSWHKYDIHVGFKDAVFEPYNCLQHLCELRDVLSRN